MADLDREQFGPVLVAGHVLLRHAGVKDNRGADPDHSHHMAYLRPYAWLWKTRVTRDCKSQQGGRERQVENADLKHPSNVSETGHVGEIQRRKKGTKVEDTPITCSEKKQHGDNVGDRYERSRCSVAQCGTEKKRQR